MKLDFQNDSNVGIVDIQKASSPDGPWQTFFYTQSTNVLTTLTMPSASQSSRFYRLIWQDKPRDPSLRMHLSFDNDFSNGVVLDISGHNNNGYRYNTSLWPKSVAGINGSQAGSFNSYTNTDPQFPLGTGDYVAVTVSPDLDRLTNGTVMIWGEYGTNSYHNATLIDTAYSTRPGSWCIGRSSQMQTSLLLTLPDGNQVKAIYFPDATGTNGYAGGWHHYCFSFDGTTIKAFFDGVKIGETSQAPFPELTLAGYFIGLATKHHIGTPVWGDDPYPNNGWLVGKLDDARIYNRCLSDSEIVDIYKSFDIIPPTSPSVTVHADSSTMAEIRWTPSTDKFGVDRYVVERDGVAVGETTDLVYFDANLSPNTTYNYTVQALDITGHYSVKLAPSALTTPAAGSPVDIVLDDADNVPWIEEVGDWPGSVVLPGYLGVGYSYDNNAGKGTKSFGFRPLIPETGNYKVYFRYPAHTSFEPSVPVDIVHANGTNTVIVNQRVNGNTWNLLGTFSLNAGTNAVVRVRNAGTTKSVVVDAVRFTK